MRFRIAEFLHVVWLPFCTLSQIDRFRLDDCRLECSNIEKSYEVLFKSSQLVLHVKLPTCLQAMTSFLHKSLCAVFQSLEYSCHAVGRKPSNLFSAHFTLKEHN